MFCRYCRLERRASSDVCPRCRFSTRLDRRVCLHPTRRRTKRRSTAVSWADGVTQLGASVARSGLVLSGVVPGLGHILSGRAVRGLGFFAAVVILACITSGISPSPWARFATPRGLLVGVACAVHAWSVVELMGDRIRRSVIALNVALMACTMALFAGIYAPLLMRRASARASRWVQMREMTGDDLHELAVLVAMVFVVSLPVAWLWRRLLRGRA